MIVGGVVVLAALGGGGWFFFLNKPSQAQIEAAEKAKNAKKPVVFVEMKEMVIGITAGPQQERAPVIKIKVVLEIADPKVSEEIKPLLPRVEDAFQVFMRELRPSDLEGSAGMYPAEGGACCGGSTSRSIRPRSTRSCSRSCWSSEAGCGPRRAPRSSSARRRRHHEQRRPRQDRQAQGRAAHPGRDGGRMGDHAEDIVDDDGEQEGGTDRLMSQDEIDTMLGFSTGDDKDARNGIQAIVDSGTVVV